MSHCHLWEAKIKVAKKPRKLRSPNRNPSRPGARSSLRSLLRNKPERSPGRISRDTRKPSASRRASSVLESCFPATPSRSSGFRRRISHRSCWSPAPAMILAAASLVLGLAPPARGISRQFRNSHDMLGPCISMLFERQSAAHCSVAPLRAATPSLHSQQPNLRRQQPAHTCYHSKASARV